MSEFFKIIRTNKNRDVKIVFTCERPIQGSARYPDPNDAKGTIKQAGYLASINRDDAVIARPAGTGQIKWVQADTNSLKGFIAENENDLPRIRAVLNDAIKAAEAELLAIKTENAAAQQLAASGQDEADPKVEAALAILAGMTAEQRQEFFSSAQAKGLSN